MAKHQPARATAQGAQSRTDDIRFRRTAVPPLPPTSAPMLGDANPPAARAERAADQIEQFNQASRMFDQNVLHAVRVRTHRASVVLRMLQASFADGEPICRDDLEEVVALVTETLPHPYEDIDAPLSDYDFAARRAVREANDYGNKLSTILEAMTTVARGDTTLEALSSAADAVFGIARDDPAYEPDWRTMLEVLESRGFQVRIEEINGMTMGANVSTPALEKHRKRQDRALKTFIKAVNEGAEARRARATAQP